MNITKRLLTLRKCARFSTQMSASTQKVDLPPCQEVQIPVPWGHIAGKWWGPTDRRPILALHGWQDNCGSFNRLIPLLTQDVGYLAVDFPGHGWSSRLPPGIYYHSIDYIIVLRYLIDYFQWRKVSLMGHSLGAVTSFAYTMLYPNDVDFVICLDAFKPVASRRDAKKMARNITSFLKYVEFDMSPGSEPPAYSLEEIYDKIHLAMDKSVEYGNAHHIAERNTAPSVKQPGKFVFTRDPRVKLSNMIDFPQDETMEGAKGVKCPIFVCKALGSGYYEEKKLFYDALEVLRKASKECQLHFLDGTHHLHLNTPDYLAERINKFIDRYDREDRSIGGFKPELVVEEKRVKNKV